MRGPGQDPRNRSATAKVALAARRNASLVLERNPDRDAKPRSPVVGTASSGAALIDFVCRLRIDLHVGQAI